jgi:hypothetical protein
MRFIDEVCNLYDCEVLADCEQVEGLIHSVVSIGSRGSYENVEVSFTMTPRFNSLEELEAFCSRHIEKFRMIAEDPDSPAPDATEWAEWEAAISN